MLSKNSERARVYMGLVVLGSFLFSALIFVVALSSFGFAMVFLLISLWKIVGVG